MKIEYFGIAKQNLNSGIDIDLDFDLMQKHIDNIKQRKVSTMLDWLDLPDISENELQKIENIAKKCENMTDFVVFGVGGSALGVKFLDDTFVRSLNKKTKTSVHVCDNIDAEKLVTFLDELDLEKTMFNVVTKSGSTTETLVQMLIVMERYNKIGIDFRKHIVVTTTQNNDLWNWAQSEGVDLLSIPKGVGGRYSVLSAVGLLPAKVMGLDLQELLNGAKKARDYSFACDKSNLSYLGAYINFAFYQKGLKDLVTMPYSDRLSLLPEFLAQLWAESLAKKHNRKGEIVFAGQTPIRTKGVTDQHSQLQLYSEGPKNKLLMFFRVDNTENDETVSITLPFAKHLNGVSLKKLFYYEFNATAFSLTSIDRPNYTIVLDEISEKSIGELIFMLEMMTAFMGEMMDVNAFDQPGVELSKTYTKAMLGVDIEASKAKQIKDYMLDKEKFVLD